MITRRLLHVALALGALTVVGCGGGSSSSADRNKDVTSDNNARPSDPKAEMLEPSTNQWKYETTPDPAPSKTPKDRLNEVTFDRANSAVLLGEAAGVARDAAKKLVADSGLKIYLLGFAHKAENASMGLSRANAVKDFLIKIRPACGAPRNGQLRQSVPRRTRRRPCR